MPGSGVLQELPGFGDWANVRLRMRDASSFGDPIRLIGSAQDPDGCTFTLEDLITLGTAADIDDDARARFDRPRRRG